MNSIRNKVKLLLFGIALLGVFACSKNEVIDNKITMLLTSNVRGQLDPCGWKATPLGGLPRRFTYIDQIRQSGADPILLDAGEAQFDNYYL